MNNLTQKKCVPCEGGTDPLTGDELKKYFAILNDWQAANDQKSI